MQRPCSHLFSTLNMQILSRKSIVILHESLLINSFPSLYFSIAKRLSSAHRPIISHYNRRSFHSIDQFPEAEEGDAAARVWALHENSSQKGKLEDSGEDEEQTEVLSPERFRWSSRAGGKVSERKTKMKISWVCKECGVNLGQWWGSCPTCKTVGSVKRFVEAKLFKSEMVSVSENKAEKLTVPQRLVDVNKGMNQSDWRIPL